MPKYKFKRRLYFWGGYCCYSFRSLFSSRLLSKNLKIKIYKYVIASGFDGSENVCLTVNKCRFNVLGDKLLTHIYFDEGTEKVSKNLNISLVHGKYDRQKIF